MNTPYSRVTGVIQKSLQNHLLLLGVIIVAFAAGSMLINRNERMKIKAEEEVRRWQERMEVQQRAEERLQLERNKLKAIMDSMNDGVYVVDRQHEILYANPTLEKELGPIAGRKCYEYLFGNEKQCPWCNDEAVFAGETFHWEGRSRDNGRIYDIFNTPFVGPAGNLCKLGIRREVTERKKAEAALQESEIQLRSLSSQILRAQEMERKRVSQELHDELGQALLVMKLRLNYIEESLLPGQEKLKEECQNGVK